MPQATRDRKLSENPTDSYTESHALAASGQPTGGRTARHFIAPEISRFVSMVLFKDSKRLESSRSTLRCSLQRDGDITAGHVRVENTYLQMQRFSIKRERRMFALITARMP